MPSPDRSSFGSSNQRSSNLGLTTGNVWHGNTAYGPAGGMATGYSTRQPSSPRTSNMSGSAENRSASASRAPAGGNFSNFRNPDGSATFDRGPGAPGGAGVNARNGLQAASIADTLARMLTEQVTPTGGTLPNNAVIARPIVPPNVTPPMVPPVKPPPGFLGLEFRYNNQLSPGGYPGMWQRDPTVHRRGEPRQSMNWSDASGWPGQNTSPTMRPGQSKANGPLGSGWQDRVSGSPGGIPGFSANGNLGTSFGPNVGSGGFRYNGR